MHPNAYRHVPARLTQNVRAEAHKSMPPTHALQTIENKTHERDSCHRRAQAAATGFCSGAERPRTSRRGSSAGRRAEDVLLELVAGIADVLVQILACALLSVSRASDVGPFGLRLCGTQRRRRQQVSRAGRQCDVQDTQSAHLWQQQDVLARSWPS